MGARGTSRKWVHSVSVILVTASLAWLGPADAADAPLSNAGPLLDEYGQRLQDLTLSEAERLQFLGLLARWGTPQVRQPLLAVLKDSHESIRAASARALGWKGNSEAVAGLQDRVTAPDEKVAVRVAAIESLGRIGDSSAREALLAVTKESDPAVRGAAFSALTFENLQSPADRAPLLRQMAGDTTLDTYIRCQAIQALALARDGASRELLMTLLEREPVSPMPLPSEAPSEREMMAIRYRQARDVRAWAAKALWVLEARSAIPLLLKTAEEPNDFFLRLASLETLGSWRVHEAMPVFLRRLEDPFPQNRITALWALADIGDKSVVNAVAARLADSDPNVRGQAVETLGELGDARVRQQLQALQDSERDTRVQEAIDKAIERLPK